MAEMSFGEVDDKVLGATGRPVLLYFFVLLLLSGGIAMGLTLELYQVKNGLGVTHLHDPVDWGNYIANFVYWVGIAHSGTFISAILYLARAKFRESISRATEAMTIFAIATAGLFPLIHLGRFWVSYYFIPYPSQRHIWPNFQSALMWDVMAVSTYFTVSVIFFYVGLLPDLASFRDRFEAKYGRDHWGTILLRLFSLGWSGFGRQWRHYSRGYLYFAALATPLVISVHSVVSFDFSMSLLPGWHTTIYAPYFVAGAIHSGLAMSLVLLIPMRKLLKLEDIIKINHLEGIAMSALVTTGIVGYAYFLEPLIDWYSGDKYEIAFAQFQAHGWIAPVYWSLFFFNVIAPLSFVFKKARRSLPMLFTIGILVNIGMWLERMMIVPASTSHDFMPHNWSSYFPNLIELGIAIAGACFFFFWYLGFSKLLPVVPMYDVKTRIGEDQIRDEEEKEKEKNSPAGQEDAPVVRARSDDSHIHSRCSFTAIYKNPYALIEAVKKIKNAGFGRIEYFSPIKIEKLEKILYREKSPVRYFTLLGAVGGAAGGFALSILTAEEFGLIVGGKHPVSLIPYCIIGFEMLVLFGSLFNLFSLVLYMLPYRRSRVPYKPDYCRDKFALITYCDQAQTSEVQKILAGTNPEATNVSI